MISKVMPEMILEKIFEIINIRCLSPAKKLGIGKVDKDMALFYEDKKEKEEK